MGYAPVRPSGLESRPVEPRTRAGRAIYQEHTQQRPAESRERFKEVFENAAVAMTLVDLDERILEANPSACALLGYARDELVVKTIRDITYPDDLNADLEQLERLLGSEVHSYQIEKRYVCRDGRVVWGS